MWDFWDLVNIEEFWEKREYFNPERWDVAFYCKDCEKIVKTQRKEGKKYVFTCNDCSGNNIAIGTQTWLKDNYNRKRF